MYLHSISFQRPLLVIKLKKTKNNQLSTVLLCDWLMNMTLDSGNKDCGDSWLMCFKPSKLKSIRKLLSQTLFES